MIGGYLRAGRRTFGSTSVMSTPGGIMVRRVALIVVALIAATLSGLALPGAAHAQANVHSCDEGSRHWVTPYLSTGFGPVARYTEVVTTPVGKSGRVGFYSPLTRRFNPESGWVSVHSSGWKSAWVYEVNTPFSFQTVGYASLQTPYGPTVWSTQFVPTSTGNKARWGTWNLITNRFYPSSGWTDTAAALCPF
jgi:hypothetical protein